ncbi:hypothetical protein [Desulfonatronovibrio magnus]|uniref:hypothetical protein n=1 Tax=Desulfonatronovibrio magnus TaxID=698827 RepID=UPI0012FB4F9D|nr:hypothetical protein [Desulfonatronovibrio magnus]
MKSDVRKFRLFFLPLIFSAMLLMASQVSATNIELQVSGASNEIVSSGQQLRSGLNYFLPGDLLELTVENTSSVDGNAFISISLRSDSSDTQAQREWIERWFVYNHILPLGFPTISGSHIPQPLTMLPAGSKITLLHFYVDSGISMRYPVIITAYLYDAVGGIIGFDSITIFFRPL